MKIKSNQEKGITIGIDLGDKKHAICVLDHEGEIIDERSIVNTRESLKRLSARYPLAMVACEVGSHSPWISRFLKELGHRVIVANPRKLRAIYQNTRKSDAHDARILAKIARVDKSLLYPITHCSEKTQRDFIQLKLRDNIVRQRVDVISSVRFTLKSIGVVLRSPNTNCFARYARHALQDEKSDVLQLVEPSLTVIDAMTAQIKVLDKELELLAETHYPVTQKLRDITGIGLLTSLAFVLTVEDPERFAKSRDVGAYLGLVPKRDQSGTLDKELRISKAGNKYMRKLLISAAQYIIGPFGEDCELRNKGMRLLDRGGQRAKKKPLSP
ncbi:MAG: IS110 family transposase [Akkermansiaceae bacterium]